MHDIFRYRNLNELFAQAVAAVPDRIALLSDAQQYTYREMDEAVQSLACRLQDAGVQRGSVVATYMTNRIEMPIAYLACFRLGAIVEPLNERFHHSELTALMRKASAEVLFTDLKYSGFSEGMELPPSIRCIIDVGSNGFEKYKGVEARHVSFDAQEGDAGRVFPDIDGTDVARYASTGGSTSDAKIVVRTHLQDVTELVASALNNSDGQSSALVGQHEVYLCEGPYSHHAGFTMIFACLCLGGTFLVSEKFDSSKVLECIERHKVTFLNIMPPTTYLRMSNDKDYDLSSVSIVSTAAGANFTDIDRHIFAMFPNAKITYVWGSTEAGAGTSLSLYRDTFLDQLSDEGNIGHPLEGVRIKLVDSEGNEAEEGEALLKGPSVTSGYLVDGAVNTDDFVDGWFPTGDVMRKGADDNYVFVGRAKDMIKSGGENIFAQEIETIILKHPAVRECAVIGVPDKQFGESVCAVVKLNDGYSLELDELQIFFKRYAASYKKPRYLEICHDFPVDSMGKVRKPSLKARYGREVRG